MQFTARRYDTSELVSIEIVDGRIQDIALVAGQREQIEAPWVAPGLVDLQVNGHGGREFSDGSLAVDHVAAISTALDRDGVTSYCPTVTSHTFDTLAHALATLAQACAKVPDVADRVAGIHLEGPYISPHDGPRGAHPRAFVRPPDWDEFQRLQDAAEGRIRILTLSPEYEGSAEFISRATAAGVLVAIGHTAADSDQIQRAVDAGARLSTHLGNGAHPQIRRHPNYIWDQLAEDRLAASLIADGHHLPPAVVKTFIRAKSPERCVLVSDQTGMGGLPPGRYESASLGAVEILDDGRLVVAGQREILAGAALPLRVGIANVMRFAGQSLPSAIAMASTKPRELLACEPVRLCAGSVADLVLFRLPGARGDSAIGEFEVVATIHRGKLVHGRLP